MYGGRWQSQLGHGRPRGCADAPDTIRTAYSGREARSNGGGRGRGRSAPRQDAGEPRSSRTAPATGSHLKCPRWSAQGCAAAIRGPCHGALCHGPCGRHEASPESAASPNRRFGQYADGPLLVSVVQLISSQRPYGPHLLHKGGEQRPCSRQGALRSSP